MNTRRADSTGSREPERVKNQYFADRRDLFKYDLLLDLAECQSEPRLVFIPMLTPNDGTREGSVRAYECGARRRMLFDVLRAAVATGKRDIQTLRAVLPRCGVLFFPYRDAEYFQDATRKQYFDTVPSDWLARSSFLTPTSVFRQGRSATCGVTEPRNT